MIKLKNILKKIVSISRRLAFSPFLLLTIIQFYLREYLFGFENACNYLTKVSSDSLVHILRLRGATIGINCDIQSGIVFHNCSNFKYFTMGDNCHVGKGCFFDLRNKINIGNNVVISMSSSFVTHIDMTKSKLSNLYPAQSEAIIINDHVYIGAGSMLLMGVELGEKSFVGANSLVTKAVNANTLVAGSPVKFIKKIID